MVAAPAARAADYVVITKEVEVDRPVDAVWARVGDYGAISAWMQTDCGYLSGDGGVGTVRRLLRGAVTEVMIAQTSRSYTYQQTRGNMAFATFHGTLAAEPIAAARTRLVYTLFYDQTVFVADADRRAQRERLGERFQQYLEAMKAMAEAEPVMAPAPARSVRSRRL
jgi:uncharacterized protein YndB with AHSA1/START domain